MRYAAAAALLAACATTTPAARPAAPAARAAPAAPTRAAEALGVPVLSDVRVEAADGAPARVRDARFDLEDGAGAWTEAAPVVDGEAAPPPGPRQRAASFLVDFDQAPLTSMCEAAPPSVDAILAAVDARIARKSLAVSIVTASVAAERREGDCTEHAMVAAALLRCRGIPARLAFGMLVARVGDRWVAGGHMWAEYHDGGWRVADATRPERHGEVAYLRFGTVDDEGPGGVLSMVNAMVRRSMRRVRVSAR